MPYWDEKFSASAETLIVMSMDPLPYGVIQHLRSKIRNHEELGMEGSDGIVLLLEGTWWVGIDPTLDEMAAQAKRNLEETGRTEVAYLYLDPNE